ncbi:acyltransferase family protein [Serratia symbiotica]|uniref:acyltransferase family protein n=1 Tax=Serratia symbiotica TaxID=138074 RepID=UPI0033144B9A
MTVSFFILSGMVIPYSLKSEYGGVRFFIVSRFFRLYPAYWFSVLIAVITSMLFYQVQPEIKVVLLNTTMLQSVFGIPNLFGVYWTLIIELLFYGLCVFIFIFGLLKNRTSNFIIAVSFLILAVAISWLRWYLDRKIPVAVPLALSLMFFGSLWREATVKKDIYSRNICIWWTICFALSLPAICFLAFSKSYGFGENPIAYLMTYACSVAFFIVVTSKWKLTFRPFIFLGTISYSMYLLHQFALELFSRKFNISGDFSFLKISLYLLAVLSLSYLSYRFIEKSNLIFSIKIKGKLHFAQKTL